MTDDPTRTRFLASIAAQIPPARVIELHLFGAIRQGGMESGVAVIAVDPNEPVESTSAGAALVDVDSTAETHALEATIINDADQSGDALLTEVSASVEAVLHEPVVQADGQVASTDEVVSPDASDASTGDHAGYDAPVDAASEDAAPTPRVPAPRYIVFTARYRHTLKGLDRGKWEVSVTEEADAPLLTVDAVVRGVSRRSGEADETVRLSGDEFRAALPDPLPAAPVRKPVMGRRA